MKYYKRSTMTLIAWILSFFMLISAIVMVPSIIELPIWRYHIILVAFLLLAPCMNALIQNGFVLTVKNSGKFFFKAKFKESPIYEIVISLSAIILLPMVPGITLISGVSIPEIAVYMMIWLAIVGMTTWTSYKTTTVNFYSDLVCVSGLNFFKSAGMSQRVMTALGIYEYNEFLEFTVTGNTFKMTLMDHQGQVTFSTTEDQVGGVAAFLAAKGIERV